MARRKRKTSAARVLAGLPVIERENDVLEPVYEADPDGRPVVHHRTVDTLGIMLRAGTITKDMHDAARDFQAQFTIACYDTLVCMRFRRDPLKGNRAELTETQIDARRRVGKAMDALGGLGSPAGGCVWHVLGLQRSVREWAMRQGWGGRPVRVEQAQGILIAALGTLAGHYGEENKRP
jgi:Domain of unknown function (DUF6456)